MLLNLIKYDLKFIYKQLIIYYLMVLVAAIIARLTAFDGAPQIIVIISEFARSFALCCSIGLIVNGTMRTWVRLSRNFYGDESYLTHTLPLSIKTIFGAKFLAGIIMLFASLLVLALAIFIIYYTPENFSLLLDFLRLQVNAHSSVFSIITLFLVAFFFQLAFMLQSGFTGIVIGHRSYQARTFKSVLWGAVVYLSAALILLGVVFLWGCFNPYIYDAMFANAPLTPEIVVQLLICISLIYVSAIAATYYLNLHLLQKGVNVD